MSKNIRLWWHKRVRQETLVFVSQRTSSCWTRSERWPATWLPKHHGKQWQPGSRTSSNFPKVSLIATFDWSTWIQPKAWPIFIFLNQSSKWKQNIRKHNNWKSQNFPTEIINLCQKKRRRSKKQVKDSETYTKSKRKPKLSSHPTKDQIISTTTK